MSSMRSPSPSSENLRGAAFMTAAMAGFAVNDTIMKGFAGELGIGQVVLLRGLIASFLVYLLARRLGHMRPAKVFFEPLIILRSLAEMAATFLYLTALFHMPIANASAILQALPLAMTLSAAMFLRERVGWRRLTAVLIGLVGVMVVIRPGVEGFSTYSLYALGAVAACVVRDMATRHVRNEVPALYVTFVSAVVVALLGGGLSLFEEWKPVTSAHLGMMASSAAFLLVGYFFVVTAMRTGDIGFVAPFRYAVLVFSIIGGIVVYREFPDTLTYVGSAIVVIAGVYMLHRERVVHRQSITAVAPMRS